MSPTPRPRRTDEVIAGPPHGRLQRARRVWVVVSLVVLVAGLGFTRVALDVESRAQRDQASEAMDIATRDATAAMRLELQRQTDFVTDTAGFVAIDPDIVSAELRGWIRATQVLERYPELDGVGFVRYVPRDELDDHAARIAGDPELAGALEPDGTLRVAPDSDRPTACLVQAFELREDGRQLAPPNEDLCADPQLASTVGPIIATGQSTYRLGPEIDGSVPLLVLTPVFDGDRPTTVVGRREAFLGSVVTLVDADQLIDRVASLRDDVAVRLRYRDANSDVDFVEDGFEDAEGPERVVPLVPGWQLTVRAIDGTSASWTANRIVLVAAGIAAPILLAALLFVLGTSRARALDLVDEATEELRHLSLHDPLTGLANRRLLSQRADAMLARARRDGSVPSALFIDLDGFKEVNDTHGHAAGDVVLQTLGRRLREVVRTSDTVGRFGGDEFVVLLDGTGPGDRAEVVAARLLEAVRQPIVVDPEGTVVAISASVGVASGARDDGDVLIHDADVAAYRAKAAGKDRWMAATGEPDVPSLS